jgi:hypothetical protein
MTRCVCPKKGTGKQCVDCGERYIDCCSVGKKGEVDKNCGDCSHLKDDGKSWEANEQETDGYYQECIWLPRLDELLAEIEKRGWQIELVKYARWRITIWKIQWRKQGLFIGETPGEVAAKALIWLLKQNESTNVSCTETLG